MSNERTEKESEFTVEDLDREEIRELSEKYKYEETTMSNEKSKFYITVLWGEVPEPDSKPNTYTFNTIEERDAFELGINETIGWSGYDYKTHEEPKEFKHHKGLLYTDSNN